MPGSRGDCMNVKVLHRRDDLAELAGTRNEVMIDRLAHRLRERGPLAVRDTVIRRQGDRVTYVLDDDSVLALRMFWPRPQTVAALMSVRWDDRIGWVVVVRTSAGKRMIDYAWLATLTPLPAASLN
jgi:hypothetical protein